MTTNNHVPLIPVALVAMLAATTAIADGLIVIHDPPVVRPDHYRFAPLDVRYHHVSVSITDQVAVTEVDQTFFNPNNARLEGTYLFPIPKGAQIDSFKMDINGTMVEAELLDAAKARSIYEDIVRRMRDPALLEYAGQGLFKVRIFPIEPRSDKQIKLKYTQILRSDAGVVQYLYPLNTEKFSASPLKSVAIKVELQSSRGLRSVYSPSHPVEVKRHGENRAVVGYEDRDIRPDTDFELLYSMVARDDVGLDLLTFNDGDAEGGTFALLAAPSPRLAASAVAQKDVVFVLDTSGSMAEGGKLEQAKRALRFCLANLNNGDRFEVVRFSTETEALFERLVEATKANRDKAEEFVNGLKPIGGTAIEDALVQALAPAGGQGRADRPYVVIFLTDGKPTIGSTKTEAIVAHVSKAMGDRQIRIFCFGIGTDINTHLLDTITERTRSVSQYVLPKEDIEVKVSSFYGKINQPVLTGLKLRITGDVRVSKLSPSELPDLFRGEQLVVFGRYSGSGDAAVTLSGTFSGQPRSFTNEFTFPRRATAHQLVPRLWATRRVGFLLDQIRLNGESKELKDEVVSLARRYGIVTPYTAYLIVEDESVRNVPVANRTLQIINGDREARAEAGRVYREVQEQVSGEEAVGGAMAMDALKRADNAVAQSKANAYAGAPAAVPGGLVGGAPAPAVNTRVQQAINAQATRFVNGRTFFQNGSLWIDGNVQARPNAAKRQVKFNSAEYFALMSRHPEAAQWLSVGRNVQVMIDEEIIEVVE